MCSSDLVQLDGVFLQCGECFAEVVKECLFLLGLDDDVVHLYLNIAADLLLQAVLHHTLVCSTRVLEPEGHRRVTVDTKGCDERCLLFVFLLHPDLVVA